MQSDMLQDVKLITGLEGCRMLEGKVTLEIYSSLNHKGFVAEMWDIGVSFEQQKVFNLSMYLYYMMAISK